MNGRALDGRAIVWCEGAFATPNGKTAHGLVRFTHRYEVLSVLDSRWVGRDAAEVLDGSSKGIPVYADLASAIAGARSAGKEPTHFVIGLAPDGGRLPPEGRRAVLEAIDAGLHVDSGLHDFLAEDADIANRALARGVAIRDVRRTPNRKDLHFFTGGIERVGAFRIAMLGTDSAVGKRTTAWILVRALEARGCSAQMIGTGQTAWMQGVRHGVILDSLINDFVSGELENAVIEAWRDERPDFVVIEGQGSLMNPAYPGGYEILAATRPHAVVLQHAPERREYDGFPGYAMHPVERQIQAIELVSGVPVVAVTLNHEGIADADVPAAAEALAARTGLPCRDPLVQGLDPIVDVLIARREVLRGGS